MKINKTLLLVVAGLILVIGINYLLFAGVLQGMPPAVEQALLSDDTVQVTAAKTKLVMEPVSGASLALLMYGEDERDVRIIIFCHSQCVKAIKLRQRIVGDNYIPCLRF